MEPLPGIDINGLSSADRARIAEIGLWGWMDEIATKQPSAPAQPAAPENEVESHATFDYVKRQTCEVCGRKFPFTRADAKCCSARCRKKRSRSQCHT